MERGSDAHSARIDEQMQHESESFTRGEPIEARAEDFRQMEEADDAILSGDRRHDALRERSDLARHLRGSIFPADAFAIVTCAVEEHAPDDLVARLHQLPLDELFLNVEGVWEALGGARDQRSPDDSSPDEPRVVHASELEPFVTDAEVAPGRPEARRGVEEVERYAFRFDRVHRLAGAPFMVSPASTSVVVDRERARLVARFGPWCVETTLANIAGVATTGPYQTLKTIGPPHVSLVDRGLTFATNDQLGLCIRFRTAVRGVDPLGLVRHPAITVTVADVDALRAALSP